MIGIGMYRQGVPRQGFPKPQILTELGDKGKVLEYLMAEWYEIQELQMHDAPALVAHLHGDKAVRQDRMLDAFRNAAAQHAIEMLCNSINSGVIFEADIAKYQQAYDAIGPIADAAAQASMKMLGDYVAFCEQRALPPERTHKVALGDCWRSKRHEGATLRVTSIAMTIRKATLEGQGGMESAGMLATMLATMSLDENGFCVDPEGNWKLFACEVPENRSQNLPPPPAAVEVGQRWLRRTKDGSTEGVVTSIGGLGSAQLPYALLSTVTPGHLMRMPLGLGLTCKKPEEWSRVNVGVSALAEENTLKVAMGQRWINKPKNAEPAVLVVTSVQPNMAMLEGPLGRRGTMSLTGDGCAKHPEYWEPASRPFDLRFDKVETGQVWYQRIGEGGRQGRVVGVLTNSEHGREAILEGHVEHFVMPLNERDQPDLKVWSFYTSYNWPR